MAKTAIETTTSMSSDLVFMADMLQMTVAGHSWVECCTGHSLIEVKEELEHAIESVGVSKVHGTRIRTRNTVIAERIIEIKEMTGYDEELINPDGME